MKDEKVIRIDLPFDGKVYELALKKAKERGVLVCQMIFQILCERFKDELLAYYGKEGYERMFKRHMDLNKDTPPNVSKELEQ